MKKELKGFITGSVLTGLIMISIPTFAGEIVKAIDVSVNTVKIKVNGKLAEADNFLYDGRTYVQVRDICDMLDKEIEWDESTNTAHIKDKKVEEVDPDKENNGETSKKDDKDKTTVEDTAKPTVESVKALTGNSVEVVMSEKVDKNTAEDVGNYSIAEMYGSKKKLAVVKAELDSSGEKVVLTTDGQNEAILYKIEVSGVTDIAGNIIESNSMTFVGLKSDGSVIIPDDPNLDLAFERIGETSSTTVELVFNKTLSKESAENISNYKIQEKYGLKDVLTVTKAELDSTGKKVILTTSVKKAVLYELIMSNIISADGKEIKQHSVSFAQ